MQGKKRVLFYLVDGAHSEVLPELLEKGLLPNIKRIVDEGTMRKATTCFPSTTGSAYLPFLTGHFPGSMGVTGIRWFDKKEFKRTRLNKYAMRSYCGPEAAWFNTDMPAEKKTLFELLGETYNLNSMVTRGVAAERDLMAKGKSKLYIRAHFFQEHHNVDEESHRRLMTMLRSGKDFDFIFFVLPSVDWDSHMFDVRDEKTVAAYQIADNSLGEVRGELEKKGWWDDTLFILTSDHGLTATQHHLDIGDWLTENGLKCLTYPVIWRRKPKSVVMISGNSFGSVHLLNHTGDHVLRETALKALMGGERLTKFLNEKAIDFIAYRGDQENTFIVQNKDGQGTVTHIDGKYGYDPGTSDPLKLGKAFEVAGHREALEATFDSEYPDSLVQITQLFSSVRAGDFVVSASIGYDLRDFWEYPEHKGSHGSLHKSHIHVPLIYNQKNWKTHQVRTADVFSTILQWKGITGIPSEGESLIDGD
ncbi:alkaline phosphatase family protein [Hufsiella ginkgonis]|uniref:Sulfatase-like hydrolase/transferase n=1 Tax=Hufsiella ginkgonis TaxID=2695274 RepID=A0A7K1XUE1_9SPHI|nr:alkaline phosphatase family protein [Hufsiella ginkgonis]MXV14604.1 hypothetical protein [Hufsiella ginkgonis]